MTSPSPDAPKKVRKKRELPADFVRRPVDEMLREYGELIDEVEASIARSRGML